jgi:type VI secretion system protein
MALRLHITSRHRQALGERGAKEFGHDGGTIGRSLESDWVLPDGQRYISSRHASIDFRSGSYYIVDTSTNGVYVNDAEQPVGRGNPQRLFTGDRIRLGEYEMSVEIDEEESTTEQLSDNGHVDPVVRAQRVPPPDPTRADLIQPHEITAVGIEVLLKDDAEFGEMQKAAKLAASSLRLEEDAPAEPPARAAAAKPNGSAPSADRAPPPPVSAAARVTPAKQAGAASAPAKPAASPAAKQSAPPSAPESAAKRATNGAAPERGPGSASALDAFFRGAGLPLHKLDDKQAEQALHRLGQLLRELIVGVTENLHVRTEQKNALRIPNTTIQPQNNNPLKFAAGVDEALENLLFRQSSEYLTGVEAVREACVDIKQHQQALLAAVRAAVVDYIGRLDPEELESKFTNGKRGGLMSAANKLKYWDLYKDLYQVVSQGQQGQLPHQFLEELTRAYEHEATRAGGSSNRKPQARAN